MGRATAIILPEPGLTATFIPNARPDDNRIELDLTIAAGARVGLHRMSVITPLGVPAMQSFAVAADPEVVEKELNDVVSDQGGLPVTPTALPATLVGSIDRPGDVDFFPFEAKAGQQLVFQVLARAIGSQLRPELIVLDARGHIQARATAGSSVLDPVLTFTAQSDGLYFLQVADADFGGSGSHFYRIAAGQLPIVQSVFPLGIERGADGRDRGHRVEPSGCQADLHAGRCCARIGHDPGGTRGVAWRKTALSDEDGRCDRRAGQHRAGNQ